MGDGEPCAGADVWAAVVAEVLGFEHDEALTLRQAGAGLNACSKGVSLKRGKSQPSSNGCARLGYNRERVLAGVGELIRTACKKA